MTLRTHTLTHRHTFRSISWSQINPNRMPLPKKFKLSAYDDGACINATTKITHLFLFCWSGTTITTIYKNCFHMCRSARPQTGTHTSYTLYGNVYRVRFDARVFIDGHKTTTTTENRLTRAHLTWFISFPLPICRRFVSWTSRAGIYIYIYMYMTTLNLTRSQTCLNV